MYIWTLALALALCILIAASSVQGVTIGVSQYSEARETIPFEEEQAKKYKIVESAIKEVETRFSRSQVVALQLQKQPLYWKYWRNETVKARIRNGQGYREVDHIFSTNFHVTLRARSTEEIIFRHQVILNVEPRRQNPSIIGHWFSEDATSESADTARLHHAQALVREEEGSPVDKALILSWNVWNFNAPWAERVKRLAAHIRKQQPVVIGFQEMRYDASASPAQLGPPFQVRHLADLLPEYQYIYQPAMMYLNQGEHTDEGQAIFSRWPIVETSWTPLSRDRDDKEDDHQRIVLRACVQTPRGAKINFFTTHLSLSLTARRRSAVEIWHYMRQFDSPSIIVGDFNEEPQSELLNFLLGHLVLDNERADLRDSWLETHRNAREEDGWTFDTRNMRKRIDFVLVRGSDIAPKRMDLIGQLHDGQTPNEIASDHLGVLVEMHVDIPTPAPTTTFPTAEEAIHNTYFTTSWWLTMFVLGTVFVALDVLCCCIAWYS